MIIHRHAEQLGVDASRITAGDSAGGHLALVTALRLKAAGAWQPAQLILIYPMLDATASMASYASNGEDYIITRDTLLSGYEMYLAVHPLPIRMPARSGAKIFTVCHRSTS